MSEPTAIFSIYDDKDKEIREVLTSVYRALKEKGYNPINQPTSAASTAMTCCRCC